MKNLGEYIKSGIIESYVLGLTTRSEAREVEEMAFAYDEVRNAIEEFSEILERQSLHNAVSPDPIIKPMVLATINYISRREQGEPMCFPPVLNEYSKISDYSEWLEREDMYLPIEADNVYAKIISHTPQITTAIVWIRDFAPVEEHTSEIEKFLIVEGTCEITIDNDIHALYPGDFFQIPLFKSHAVKVTSQLPCKVILQRAAAA